MVKSLEQYLSDLSFSPPEKAAGLKNLSAGERVFVEKYLGLDALENLPVIEPEPLLQPEPRKFSPRVAHTKPKAEVIIPEIVVAPSPPQSVVVEKTETKPVQTITVVEPAVKEETISPAPIAKAEVETLPKTEVLIKEEKQALVQEKTVEAEPALVIEKTADTVKELQVEKTVDASATKTRVQEPTSAPVKEISEAPTAPPAELSLKDSMKQLEEIQAVSFFVAGQLFLLPVAGIQEVLRHMELIRVPQAPPFVAGVINLRGKVTPLVHLSAILTNVTDFVYDPDKNFIIICGTEPLQVGLIIDRINSMHLLPQDKVIWNVEAKLGDTADFLYALVNLNDKVCGLVAPESITKRILSSNS